MRSIAKNNSRGFSLVEIIIAVGLFIVVVGLSLGSVVSLLDSSRRVRGNKDVMDNLNSSVEYMTRTVRFGTTYHCGSAGILTVPQSCPSGDNLLAVQFRGQTLVYRRNGTKIEFSEDGGNLYKPLTSTNVIIDQLQFFAYGTDKTDNIQPYVVAVIRGRVANDPTNSAIFDLQTVMTQRKLDLNL